MSSCIFIYGGSSTGHVAWEINGGYVSFHPGDEIADLGSCELPLPGGTIKGRATARTSRLAERDADEKEYGPPTIIELDGLDHNLGAHLCGDFIGLRFPYILWNPGEVGSINCVSTSILWFTVMLPEVLPAAWDERWGSIFRALRNQDSKGWIDQIWGVPFPDLMHVHHIEAMARDWAAAMSNPGPASKNPPLPKVKPPPLAAWR